MSAFPVDTTERSLWRYRTAIGIEPRVSLGEGWTPLVEVDWKGFPILAKLDGLNPSGSFKDRGVTALLNHLLARGARAVVDDSSGNAGSSLATFAAAAGIACRIVCPASTTPEKVAQMRAHGAEVVLVDGPRDASTEAARTMGAPWVWASHIHEPAFLEGSKTIAFELWEQPDGAVPDAVVCPLGQGGNLLGLHIGFSQLIAAGVLDRMPRLYAVRAAEAMAGRPTIAAGIASPRPAHFERIEAAAAASGGGLPAVGEAEIVAALRELCARGLYVEPTTAAGAAGLNRLIEAGAVRPGERVALLLTGHGLKAAATVAQLLGA